jgi:hypothetical protein
MLTALALVACGDKEADSGDGQSTGDGGGVDCTTEARSSVSITLFDETGRNHVEATGGEGITATYTVDGGESQSCEAVFDSVVCGWEQAGDFVIVVDTAGYVPEQREVTVGEDECHVISETLRIDLVPLDDADG